MTSSVHNIKSLATLVESLNIEWNKKYEVLTQQIAALSAAPASTTAGKKVRKPKKEKDPDAPKRAPTPFFAYSAAQRAAHTGDKKLTAKDLAETWKLLSDEEKAAYKPTSPITSPAASTPPSPVPAPAAAPAADKKPRKISAQMRFQQARRAESDATLTAKQLKEEWAALSKEQQAAYESSE